MGRKKNLKVAFDSPVTTSFSLICILVFIFNTLIFKGQPPVVIFSSPTTVTGDLPFLVSYPLSYLRLILYILGSKSSLSMITELIFLMLLGPVMEERYGSVVIGIMMEVSALFSGVLNACFCTASLKGPVPVVFMLVFLNAFLSFSKKKIPLSFVIVFVLFIIHEITGENPNGFVGVMICIAGGLCGSLFAFLTSPKARAEKKKSADSTPKTMSDSDKNACLEELDSQSPRNKKNNRRNGDDDDSTVVGTLKF